MLILILLLLLSSIIIAIIIYYSPVSYYYSSYYLLLLHPLLSNPTIPAGTKLSAGRNCLHLAAKLLPCPRILTLASVASQIRLVWQPRSTWPIFVVQRSKVNWGELRWIEVNWQQRECYYCRTNIWKTMILKALKITPWMCKKDSFESLNYSTWKCNSKCQIDYWWRHERAAHTMAAMRNQRIVDKFIDIHRGALTCSTQVVSGKPSSGMQGQTWLPAPEMVLIFGHEYPTTLWQVAGNFLSIVWVHCI